MVFFVVCMIVDELDELSTLGVNVFRSCVGWHVRIQAVVGCSCLGTVAYVCLKDLMPPCTKRQRFDVFFVHIFFDILSLKLT